MKKYLLYLLLTFITLNFLGCAHINMKALQYDIDIYNKADVEFNKKIEKINNDMYKTIEKVKRSNKSDTYSEDIKSINLAIDKLIKLAEEIGSQLQTSQLKDYNKLTIEMLIVQKAFAGEIFNSFITRGEHGGNDTKYIEIQYNRKISKIQKKQKKIITNIAYELRKDNEKKNAKKTNTQS